MLDMNKIVSSVVYSPENIKKDKQLKVDMNKSLDIFKKENLENEYRAATLRSYKIQQEMQLSKFI